MQVFPKDPQSWILDFAQETSLPEGLVSQLNLLRTTYGISRGLRQESSVISKVQAYDLNIYLFWHMLGMASSPISILSMKSLKKLCHGISLPPEFTKKLDTSHTLHCICNICL